jgi:chemotaxis protein CheX
MTAQATSAVEKKTVPGSMVTDVLEVTREVFDTMVFQEAKPGTPRPGVAGEPRADVVATVALTGPSNAVITIYGSIEVAKSIAASMLGMEAAEIDHEFADAIGEMANMIAGAFRNRMTALGGQWAISLPTVTVGQRIFTHYPEDDGRVVCPFDVTAHDFCVELVLRT